MKILMVSETLPAKQLGGLAKHAVTLANALIDAGHEVVLMGRKDVDYEACKSEMRFNGHFLGAIERIDKGWKEKQLGCFNPVKRPWFARRIAAQIRQHAPGFDVVHYHGSLPMVGHYLDESVNYVQTRHDQGSDCVIQLRFKDGDICNEQSASACASCITSEPNVVQAAVSSLAVRRYRATVAQALSSHKTIFVSERIFRNAGRQMPPAAFVKARVIHNFVDPARISDLARGSQPPATGPCRILIASRIDGAKGVGAFLAEWSRVKPDHAQLDIAGDGPQRVALEALYQSESVRFLKHRSYEETIALLAASHVSVVPSLWEEPCATTILEALYLGKPCFALRRGGTPELVAYERWPGQLQLFDSSAELALALSSFISSGGCSRPADADQDASAFRADVRLLLPQILDVYEQ